MKKTNRKGFTIVELVIVIAVIAILAAVLIPTFASLVKKANISADEQAVKQMNTALAIYTAENGAPTTVAQVKKALDKNLINAESLIPVTQGYAFYWNKTDNQIVLINADNKSKLDSGEWVLLSATGYGTLEETSDATKIKNAIDNATVQNPAWIKLSSDATISDEMLTVADTNAVIFDLNSHTLSLQKTGEVERLDNPNKKATVSLYVNGGSVTIKNGKINMGETGRGILNRNGVLTLDHVEITTEKGTGVFVEGISDTSLTDTTISVVNGYGITSNSSSSSSDGSRISILGGKITSSVKEGTTKDDSVDHAAIYIPTFADVTIENCTVSGNGWGAFFRGCNATIKNSTFTHDSGFTGETTYGTSCSGKYCDIMFACGGTSSFKDYIATGNYACENVTVESVVVHQPDGGTVNVSGIEESKITRE